MHIHTKYEVSILNSVARRAVHRRRRHQRQCQMTPTPDDNYARWTNHDYIGSFGRIPNEPINAKNVMKAMETLHVYQMGMGAIMAPLSYQPGSWSFMA